MPKEIAGLKVYDVQDLSEMTGMSDIKIREYLRSGRLRGRKFGREWYVTEKGLREYFDGPMSDKSENRTLKPAERMTGDQLKRWKNWTENLIDNLTPEQLDETFEDFINFEDQEGEMTHDNFKERLTVRLFGK